MARIGTLSFQAEEAVDVFAVLEVFEDGESDIGEQQAELIELGFEQFKHYLDGKVPAFIPVTAEGDSAAILTWLKAEQHPYNYVLRIYVEYEEHEIVIGQEDSENDKDEDQRCRVL